MLIVHTVAARRFGSLLSRSVFLIGSIAGMCFGAIAMILLTSDVFQESTALSSAVFVGIAIVVGLSSSWHVMLWGDSYAAVPLDRVPLLSLFSIMIGLGFYFAVAPFIPLVRAGVVVLLPLFSGLCIVMVRKQISEMDVGISDSTALRPVKSESTTPPSSRFVLYAPLIPVAVSHSRSAARCFASFPPNSRMSRSTKPDPCIFWVVLQGWPCSCTSSLRTIRGHERSRSEWYA